MRLHERSEHAWRIAGYVGAGLGLTADVVGWALYGHLLSLQNTYITAVNTQSADRFDAYRNVDSYDLRPKIAVGAGAAVLTASLPLWLPEQRGVPWWAWVAGGAGLGTAVVGTTLVIEAGHCTVDEFGRCIHPAQATGLGAQLLLQAIPFVAVPVVYAVRALTGPRLGDLSIEAQRGVVRLRWTRRL